VITLWRSADVNSEDCSIVHQPNFIYLQDFAERTKKEIITRYRNCRLLAILLERGSYLPRLDKGKRPRRRLHRRATRNKMLRSPSACRRYIRTAPGTRRHVESAPRRCLFQETQRTTAAPKQAGENPCFLMCSSKEEVACPPKWRCLPLPWL
jgi:hypothetical protein